MQPISPRKAEPLLGHDRYKKVRLRAPTKQVLKASLALHCQKVACLQIRDLNRGTFGFVQLALDTQTDTQVAIKFIERGEKACRTNQTVPRHHCAINAAVLPQAYPSSDTSLFLQISKYVEREILNHKRLNQPHIIELREVMPLTVLQLMMAALLLSPALIDHSSPTLQVFLTPEYLAIAMEYAAGGDMFQLVVRQRGLPETDTRWYFQQLIIAIDYCHRMVGHDSHTSLRLLHVFSIRLIDGGILSAMHCSYHGEQRSISPWDFMSQLLAKMLLMCRV